MRFHKALEHVQGTDFCKDRVAAKFEFLVLKLSFLTIHSDIPKS
ncbi:hypothetical protein ALP29_200655 [Pseudomonas syringae pv. avii]|uniref:Uncharacterized protein n=1 Tax=Pseudomonas syringae pv. avii TaxID=663959 RepID=A0A3M5ULG3_PSESX|nr:hypothetical protein ALP29_200655 [Pseudomonas syringae pv. avii]